MIDFLILFAVLVLTTAVTLYVFTVFVIYATASFQAAWRNEPSVSFFRVGRHPFSM